MQTYFAFVASLLVAAPVLASIDVTIYDGVSGQGDSKELQLNPSECRDLDTYHWGNRMASFSKPQNAKCRIYQLGHCQGSDTSFEDEQAFICFLDDDFDNNVNSIECWN
ncbi:hypothetical protein BFJ70_g17547 [Fusarium oxysporum]|uniref:Uncharacterized protein n=1 Tax=Fusarium oxysporum TaxID=5507 RepID=A0A420Q2E2_FUSOX|nr:hypothetical protein BFJ71_g17004 [Fusarium oxysporum]RKK78112.1 hypothetical protein BFJ68_g17925 [Fusarium oxysporum]RKK98919.1 hypothetical protein BFJ70_g17547 [Fusarium oxysporum]